ncbi:UDP-N-acetylmuramoyl-tripeptide--D-alanyl-D-alanine ligase [Jeotgalicoccus saudimassiliensis]|uniref:UDP-N-acetylmuramoyl-tripeptide--D-alanyl-D-alanine ligase n=1 Tax=Jeotgalicoccus saudimassiliensis TaxID=1461582 RepID=A0A078MD52_9STAP|nr:UDP-N-acetylmuramoyl-tripeptide--D-alanyl-D-alanine ligase [Jeotgalicoccus saudimassiliensis]CEA03367.1 UDP-N-acetylmuramoyl-tripeptide--D-alanyl-D-alanine ligase [Jeotgalicoccus saudimassiliensis]
MIKATIEQIAKFAGGTMNSRAAEIKTNVIKGVSIDTRTIEEGNVFIPFKGENADGHRFIDMAFSKGAGVTLSERDEENADYPVIHVADGLEALQNIAEAYLKIVDPAVIAVTGSNGKTTTKDMLECVLSSKFKVQKTQGNFNNEIGMPLTILQLEEDTEISILEMGMDRMGDINFLSRMAEPDVAVITSVGESHIEMLGSRENIARAKYEIVDHLKGDGTFIYSKDYPLLEAIVQKDTAYDIHTAGMLDSNDCTISKVTEDDNGTHFTFKNVQFDIPQLGIHNALNASLAVMAGEALGVSPKEAAENLAQLEVTSMRMERVTHPSGTLIVNDAYNASKASMISAVDTVGRMSHKSKILVLADILELGDYKQELHEDVAHFINEGKYQFTKIYTFGDGAEYIHNVLTAEEKEHTSSMEELKTKVQQHFNEDTVILLKGSRGMAVERVIDDI